jgi:glycosyltransferase involved in cell wall biosynthesis
MAFLSKVIKNVDVLYSVSNDIYGHLLRKIPSLEKAKCNKIVIRNGIDVNLFAHYRSPIDDFRTKLRLDDVFLIGFVGRFIQQKGFNYLIDAINMIEFNPTFNRDYKVLAVGSGDFLDWYKKVIKERKLEHRFCFMPFQKDLTCIYKNVDLVVMPSIWEACPLQPMETLCAGVPMIASDCIGLREITRDTPIITIPSKSSTALANAIYSFIDSPAQKPFLDFKDIAIKKFDVRNTAQQVHVLFNSIIKNQLNGNLSNDS